MIDNIKLTGPSAVKGYSSEQQTKKSGNQETPINVNKDVDISHQGKVIDKLLSSPEPSQQEKINSIKSAIESGQYEINIEKVTEAVLDHYQTD